MQRSMLRKIGERRNELKQLIWLKESSMIQKARWGESEKMSYGLGQGNRAILKGKVDLRSLKIHSCSNHRTAESPRTPVPNWHKHVDSKELHSTTERSDFTGNKHLAPQVPYKDSWICCRDCANLKGRAAVTGSPASPLPGETSDTNWEPTATPARDLQPQL
ncbi:hypothetical protein QTO34_000647 [Cnephaeus nilssonii]|uniref:Uncharacterized protein n=1 Tax=Cnephaeus nilssonii TaxID=3371016 RepID=A0AA40LX51_CNENI|nr:hypothetical protein QTO34_000647 [Eptesicus nilssonii]